MKSIRSFLLARLLGGALAVLAVGAVVIYLQMTRALKAQYDQELGARLRGFASILFQFQDHVEFEFSQELMPEFDAVESGSKAEPDYFELRFDDGKLLERSDSLGEGSLATPSGLELDSEPVFWSAPLPDGRLGRFAAQKITVHHVRPEEGPGRPKARVVQIVLAHGRESLLQAERKLLAACLAGGGALLLLLFASASLAVRSGLAPARRLAATMDKIRIDQLPKNLDVGPLPHELAPVGDKLDALLKRTELAFQRERRSTADIAHELRTPISELLTLAEVALRSRDDERATREALVSVREIVWRMGCSVSTLLKLARIEMGAETFARSALDLGAIVEGCLRSSRLQAGERGLVIDCHLPAVGPVIGDEEVVRIIASNLLSNAVQYTPRGGTVRCKVEQAPQATNEAPSNIRWRLVVENPAENLEASDLRALTEPFWRKDGVRADREHAGLGLSLSRALAEACELALGFELKDGHLRATLEPRCATV